MTYIQLSKPCRIAQPMLCHLVYEMTIARAEPKLMPDLAALLWKPRLVFKLSYPVSDLGAARFGNLVRLRRWRCKTHICQHRLVPYACLTLADVG